MLRRIFSPCTMIMQTSCRMQLRNVLQQRMFSALPISFKNVLGESASVANSELTFHDGGAMGHLAEASAICSQGGSVVHATVCSNRSASAEHDFLPLTVDYR